MSPDTNDSKSHTLILEGHEEDLAMMTIAASSLSDKVSAIRKGAETSFLSGLKQLPISDQKAVMDEINLLTVTFSTSENGRLLIEETTALIIDSDD